MYCMYQYVCWLHQGRLTDGMDVVEYLMDQDNVMPRLNSRILSPGENFLDLSQRTREYTFFGTLILPVVEQMVVNVGSALHWLAAHDQTVQPDIKYI